MISIVNYGLGNLGSILNMLKYLGKEAEIIDTPAQLASANKIILPGVGAFDAGMQQLEENRWIEALNQKVIIDKVPTLGICLGMQLMANCSEEGNRKGLGWIDAEVKKFVFDATNGLKIPHMGWNDAILAKSSNILDSTNKEHRFYFVHSYYVALNNVAETLTTTKYGINFASGFIKDNIIGVQFHPEKSHRYGMELLRNFADKY